MKRLYFEWIWQWVNGVWLGFNPIGIEFEYDKAEPAITFMMVLMGVGFQITWLCPWETKVSKYMRDQLEANPEGNPWRILSVIDKDQDGLNSCN